MFVGVCSRQRSVIYCSFFFLSFFLELVQTRIHTKVSVREKHFVTSLSLEGLQVMYRLVLLIAACIQTVLIECEPYAMCFSDMLPRFTQCASAASLCSCRNRKGSLRPAQQEVIILFGFVCVCLPVCVRACICAL